MGVSGKVKIVKEKGADKDLVTSVWPTYVAFSKERVDPAYVKRFNRALIGIKKDATYARILARYR